MTDAPDLARRFLSLWEDYLTALLAVPSETEALQCWVKAGSAFIRDPGPSDRQPGPPADTASAAGPSGERDDVVAELSRRLAHLEELVTAIERGRGTASRPRRRNRRVRLRYSHHGAPRRGRASRRILHRRAGSL